MKIKYFEADLLVNLETGYHYCLMEDSQGLENWKILVVKNKLVEQNKIKIKKILWSWTIGWFGWVRLLLMEILQGLELEKKKKLVRKNIIEIEIKNKNKK